MRSYSTFISSSGTKSIRPICVDRLWKRLANIRNLMSNQVTAIDQSFLSRPGPGPELPRIVDPTTSSRVAVPHLVAERAAAAPDTPALVSVSEVVTYRELDTRANQIANYLIAIGVDSKAPNNIVGLCLDRSVNAVVFALGILKAGGAYLPLDPAYPSERLAFMLNDAQPRVLITEQSVTERLPNGPWQTIEIDRDQPQILGQRSDPCMGEISGEDLAYVIYTSGSTGRPKGVEVTHQNLMNLIEWHQDAFQINANDRASLLAGVGFDAAVWETWPYLAAGSTLHLPDESTRLSPELLRDWLVAEEISISFLPTALAERILTLQWPAKAALRYLLTGAETLRRFPSINLPFQLVNNYGPTECAVVATSGTVLPEDLVNKLPTIGRPIANTRIHILDPGLNEVVVGAAGELFIGGAGVARGYLNQPELTSERFIPDPSSREPGARLYRTGDLARYLDNGEIEYLGRIDDQIKILGHRIEPNEISAALDRHPAIQSSVVVASEDGCCEKRLVAYVVLNSSARTSAVELQEFLGEQLPRYMVPSAFVRLEMLPLTRNGKLDRAALPAPDLENTLANEAFTAPRTPIEKRLAVIVCSLLELEQVSANDNFFLLGGHSLLGTQLIGQVRGTFGVELALRTLFDSPTIEQLAFEIERLVVARVEAMSEDEAESLLA
jgi:amino acid adenylation domain-containing protein